MAFSLSQTSDSVRWTTNRLEIPHSSFLSHRLRTVAHHNIFKNSQNHSNEFADMGPGVLVFYVQLLGQSLWAKTASAQATQFLHTLFLTTVVTHTLIFSSIFTGFRSISIASAAVDLFKHFLYTTLHERLFASCTFSVDTRSRAQCEENLLLYERERRKTNTPR